VDTTVRVKQPESYEHVDPEQVQIAAIDVAENGRWIAWGYVEGKVEVQFIVAQQDSNWRWHVPDGTTGTHPVVMERIREYVNRVMLKAAGER
jgi:hypothetical protein